MGKPKKGDGEAGWSKEGADWFNSLPVEDVVEIKMLLDYGPQNEADEQKLKELRESYQKATGYEWE